jgi:16S rRNA (guanine527-N7)-methyltransferase
VPPLPVAYDDALQAGLEALGLELDAAQRAIIDGHARLLLAWDRAINLTAIREPAAVARLHVVDSLTAVEHLRATEHVRLLDLGSGGGYPGIPLAAALPGVSGMLVESVGKKARFLETALAATGLASRVSVRATRAEALARDPLHRERWGVATARAVAELSDLVELAFPLLEIGGQLIAWKRDISESEAARALRATSALGGGRVDDHRSLEAILPGHRLVVVTKTGPTTSGFPRDPAVRKRRPW